LDSYVSSSNSPRLTIIKAAFVSTILAEAIFDQGELPRVILGFMGPSGPGKSSVINALLGEESQLPYNCTEACAAVAVEISWNPENDKNKAFRAGIQFVTATEWKAELDILVNELMSLDPGARRNPTGADAKVAAAKIRTVYPDFDIDDLTAESTAGLMNDITVSELLVKKDVIEMATNKGEKFAEKIRKYIDSTPRLGARRHKAAHWPLVKVLRIFTKSPVLRTGLVLADLPGSGDSNAARVMVAQSYMEQVSAIRIVADIKRALTNSVAKNLFGRGTALKRRLLRDGLLDD
jgi:GTPase SAR1 family protein